MFFAPTHPMRGTCSKVGAETLTYEKPTAEANAKRHRERSNRSAPPTIPAQWNSEGGGFKTIYRRARGRTLPTGLPDMQEPARSAFNPPKPHPVESLFARA